ncbi:hypothetical protein ACFV4P_14290 [Kitasatospora sp. NPDC059795]|uniref:hypothetical protein n=1 Tax=Kitasatospora sp. NPDC059795 TaxID=3346949 RepID=UPI0036515351
MSQMIPYPVPAGFGGPVAPPARAMTWQASLVSVLLLVALLAALIALVLKGLKLEEAIAVLAAGGLMASELRRRLLE